MTKYEKLFDDGLNTFGAMQIKSEVISLMEFLDKRNIKNFLEIGICEGMTFFLWASLADENGLKFGIDLPNGGWGTQHPRNYMEMALIKQRLISFKPNTNIFLGDSQSEHVKEWFTKSIGKEKLDFIFIDGNHTYEGAKADYEFYSPFVRTGGVIALHDIKDTPKHKKWGCSVSKLWKEISGEKIEFCDNTEDWAGIGVIIQP